MEERSGGYRRKKGRNEREGKEGMKGEYKGRKLRKEIKEERKEERNDIKEGTERKGKEVPSKIGRKEGR